MKCRCERSHAGSRLIPHNSQGSLCPAWPKPLPAPVLAYGWGSSSQALCFWDVHPRPGCPAARPPPSGPCPERGWSSGECSSHAKQGVDCVPRYPISHLFHFHSTHPQGPYMLWESGWQILIRSEWKLKCCQ